MPHEMFEERLRANKPQFYAWERQKADRVAIDDLNKERVRGAIRQGVERGRMLASALTEPFDRVLDKLQLLTDGMPNNAATMLFSTNIYEYPQLRLRMARFRGTDKMSLLTTNVLRATSSTCSTQACHSSSSICRLVEKLWASCERSILKYQPRHCVRRLLTPFVIAKKYNLTIGIAIYDDRIEIESPGVLPPQLTPETIKQPHLSYPHNPIIADVLFKTTFLENWSSGAKRIYGCLQGAEGCRTRMENARWVHHCYL